MTCASCVARNERALRKVDGVASAEVNFATEKATVTFDPDSGVGGRPGARPSRPRATACVTAQAVLPILGMTCASCVSRVERALRKPPGVLGADVNLATEKATVTYIPGQATHADLVAAVAGRRLRGDRGRRPPARRRQTRPWTPARRRGPPPTSELKVKVVVGFVLSIIIFAGTMQPDWFPFLPSWLHNGYVLWALATPVQFWVGAPVLPHRLVGAASRRHDDEHAHRHGLLGRLLLQRAGRPLPRASSSITA